VEISSVGPVILRSMEMLLAQLRHGADDGERMCAGVAGVESLYFVFFPMNGHRRRSPVIAMSPEA